MSSNPYLFLPLYPISNALNHLLFIHLSILIKCDCKTIFSTTDLPEEIIFDAFTLKQSLPDVFETFTHQYLNKATDWLRKKTIEPFNVGNIENVLRYTSGVNTKEEFSVRLIYSFGYALNESYQNDFASKVTLPSIQRHLLRETARLLA